LTLTDTNDSFGTYFWLAQDTDLAYMSSEATVKSLTYTSLDMIPATSLIEVMKKFPNINYSFRTKLQITFDLRRKVGFFRVSSVVR